MKQSVGASILVMVTVAAVSLVPTGVAVADSTYTTPGSVNLLRHVDPFGNLPTVTASTTPGYPYDPIRAIDGGLQPWRLDGHSSTEWLRIVLPQAVTMNELEVFWRGGYEATDYTIKGSTTGFGSMTTLASDTGGANGVHPVYNIAPTSVKYLELNATGFRSTGYYITYELAAYNTVGPVYQDRGYNLFAEPGKAGTITASMQRNISDPPVQAVDNNINTFVRATNGTGPNAWFVVPLTKPVELTALGLGMWEDQAWSGVQVFLSNDSSYNYVLDGGGNDTWPGMTWTQVYTYGAGFNGAHVILTPQMVSFVRVQWPDTNGGALTEVQLFVVPEPASLALLALGGLALLRRRRG